MFISVRLWFGCATVRAVPVFRSDSFSGERVFAVFQFLERDRRGAGFSVFLLVALVLFIVFRLYLCQKTEGLGHTMSPLSGARGRG